MNEQITQAHVTQIAPLTDSIMRLTLEPERYVPYHAGQYLKILFEHEALSYSIANAPLGSHRYELHIRHSQERLDMQRLFAYIKEQGKITVSLPFGQCSMEHLDKKRPILFLAAGTGFAPVKAMIEQLLASSDKRPFELFWGARLQNDLYMDEKVKSWHTHVRHFTYFSSLSAHTFRPLVSLVLARHVHDLADWQIVLSGPFHMVYEARDVLVQKGVSAKHLYSDAFHFEVK